MRNAAKWTIAPGSKSRLCAFDRANSLSFGVALGENLRYAQGWPPRPSPPHRIVDR